MSPNGGMICYTVSKDACDPDSERSGIATRSAPLRMKTASVDSYGPIIDPNDHSDRSQTLDEDNESVP